MDPKLDKQDVVHCDVCDTHVLHYTVTSFRSISAKFVLENIC